MANGGYGVANNYNDGGSTASIDRWYGGGGGGGNQSSPVPAGGYRPRVLAHSLVGVMVVEVLVLVPVMELKDMVVPQILVEVAVISQKQVYQGILSGQEMVVLE